MPPCEALALVPAAGPRAVKQAAPFVDEGESIRVFLHMEGRVSLLEVPGGADVALLRGEAACRAGVRGEHLSLACGGRVLHDGRLLADEGVKVRPGAKGSRGGVGGVGRARVWAPLTLAAPARPHLLRT